MKKLLALTLAMVMVFASFSNVLAFADGYGDIAMQADEVLAEGTEHYDGSFSESTDHRNGSLGADIDQPSGTLGEGVYELLEDPFVSTKGTRSISGYASKFVSLSGSGVFNVYVTGSMVWEGGITFKTSCDESPYAVAVISIQRPDGGFIFQNLAFSANEERHFGFYLAAPGTYTVYYDNYIPAGATMQMQSWFY